MGVQPGGTGRQAFRWITAPQPPCHASQPECAQTAERLQLPSALLPGHPFRPSLPLGPSPAPHSPSTLSHPTQSLTHTQCAQAARSRLSGSGPRCSCSRSGMSVSLHERRELKGSCSWGRKAGRHRERQAQSWRGSPAAFAGQCSHIWLAGSPVALLPPRDAAATTGAQPHSQPPGLLPPSLPPSPSSPDLLILGQQVMAGQGLRVQLLPHPPLRRRPRALFLQKARG